MWPKKYEGDKRDKQFFYLNLVHSDLFMYYKMNFLLMYKHKFSLSELEDMVPWEREVYISLLEQHLEEEKQRKKG